MAAGLARGFVVALWLEGCLLVGSVGAVPPPAGLTRNSLSVHSTSGRYRPQKPTVSPYLALSPGSLGNLAAINYFTVVRPELTQRQVNQQQSLDLRQVQLQLRAAEADELDARAANKPQVGYMTHARYFAPPLNQTLAPAGQNMTSQTPTNGSLLRRAQQRVVTQ